jgi:hypothetical protein
LHYTTFKDIFPDDMHEDYLEMTYVTEWSEVELYGDVRVSA